MTLHLFINTFQKTYDSFISRVFVGKVFTDFQGCGLATFPDGLGIGLLSNYELSCSGSV